MKNKMKTLLIASAMFFTALASTQTASAELNDDGLKSPVCFGFMCIAPIDICDGFFCFPSITFGRTGI